MTGTAAKNADDARRFIRQSYVKNVFSTVGEAADLTKFANKATQLSTNDAMARAKAVLGDDFNDYKRIVNAISDTSTKTGNSFFQLALRQKELGTMGAVGLGASMGAGMATAGSILLAPMVLSRIVTNKQAVNHLLGMNTAVKRGLINDDTIGNAVARVIESLDDHDKDAIRKTGGGYE